MHGWRISFTARKGVSGKETSVGRAIQSYQTSQLSGSICWSFLLLEKTGVLKTDAKACSPYIGPFWDPWNYGYVVSLNICVFLACRVYMQWLTYYLFLGGREQWSCGQVDSHALLLEMRGQQDQWYLPWKVTWALRIHLPDVSKRGN